MYTGSVVNPANLEALPPEENIEESPGIPLESLPANNNENLITNDTEQIISTDELEGLANNAAPEDGFSNNVSDDSIIGTEIHACFMASLLVMLDEVRGCRLGTSLVFF